MDRTLPRFQQMKNHRQKLVERAQLDHLLRKHGIIIKRNSRWIVNPEIKQTPNTHSRGNVAVWIQYLKTLTPLFLPTHGHKSN